MRDAPTNGYRSWRTHQQKQSDSLHNTRRRNRASNASAADALKKALAELRIQTPRCKRAERCPAVACQLVHRPTGRPPPWSPVLSLLYEAMGQSGSIKVVADDVALWF